MASSSTNRTWYKSFKKETPPETRDKIREKLKQIKSSKEGITTNFIMNILKKHDNFIGVFSQDQLSNLFITSFPACLVVNLDLSTQSGSHWIGLYISDNLVEIYDSLGMSPDYWAYKPKYLLKFLKKFSFTHRILSTPVLQQPTSNACGFYCIFFLLYRKFASFNQLLSLFSDNLILNDKILFTYL